MADSAKDWLSRRYAAGEVTRHELREQGFDDYVQVLGALGLRPPVAAMSGPNVEARLLGRALIREALRSRR